MAVTQDELAVGDRVRVVFLPRASEGQAAKVTASFQTGEPEHAVYQARTVEATGQWQRVELTFPVERPRAAGRAMLVFQLGHAAQQVEIGGVSATRYGGGPGAAGGGRELGR